MLQRGLVRAQGLELVLGEVAGGEALALQAAASGKSKLVREQLDQRRLAGAVAPEQADALAGAQRERDALQHRLVAVAHRTVLDLQQGVGRRRRVTESEAERRVHMRRGDALHALERLDPALRLARLGRLGAETADVVFHVRDVALLLLEHRLLLDQALAALTLEVGIAAGVEAELLLLDVGDMGDAGVEELAVVRDQQQRAAVVAQPGFEPDHRVEVEVVGRLVEQQQVGAAHQRLRQVQAHAPAAGEIGHRTLDVGLQEAQAVEQRCRARTRRVATDLVQAGMQFANVRAIVGGLGRGQLGLDAAQLGVAVQHVVDRRLHQPGRFLGDVGDHPTRRQVEVALVGVELVAQQGEQAGLAAAVGAGEADLPAGVDLQRGGLDEDLGTAREAQIAKTDHERIHGRGAAD